MKIKDLRKKTTLAAKLLKSLGNASRLQVLCFLVEEEKNVSELQALVGLSQSALSQQLMRLRLEKIVKARKDGQQVFYSIANKNIHALLETLHKIYC